MDHRPNVLFVMTDQQRFDTIAALGNARVSTPNLDRLVGRGVTLTNAYSTCPVCVPARYTLRSGCEPTRTGIYDNATTPATHADVERRCGPYLAATMGALGYRTFGVGKFHTTPWDAPVGFDVQLHSEEMYATPEQRAGDAYARWVATQHPEYDWVEALMGERTEMYYVPQLSPLPAHLTVEAWAADRAVELVHQDDGRPWFGFVSFIGPHPPFAPPLPYNRMYDPDRMTEPVLGDIGVDHLDQQIPWMNYAVFADDVGAAQARVLKARYYGEISYIDACIGRILDAVDDTGGDTMVCFFSDHGDLLGDHHGWQKESFFEASTRVPFVVSHPARLPQGTTYDGLACLTDLFGVATTVAGDGQLRQGADLLAGIANGAPARDRLYGFHGRPGTGAFKVMVREDSYKLVWHANGGRSLLFDVATDPDELRPLQDERPDVVRRLLDAAASTLRADGVDEAFDGDRLAATEYSTWAKRRIYQFDHSRGVHGFPDRPDQVTMETPRMERL